LIALQTRLKLGQDLQSVENEINIARKQADFEFETRLKESDLALEMNRRNRQDKREDRELEAEDRIRQIDIEEREDKSDFESLKRLTDLELSKNEETRRIAREDELARAEAEQKKWREQWDAQQQKEKSIREDAILLEETLAKLAPMH
jgi:murein L,D-transpeptidase YafK